MTTFMNMKLLVLAIVMTFACAAGATGLRKRQLPERQWSDSATITWSSTHTCKMASSLSSVHQGLLEPVNIAKASCRAAVSIEQSIFKLEALINYVNNGKCSINGPHAYGPFRSSMLLR